MLLGASPVQDFTVRNAGTHDLQVDSIALVEGDPALFALAGPDSATTIAPGDSIIVSVTFAPVVTGEQSAKLRVTSNDLDDPELDVDLSGAGVVPVMTVTPDSHDFGTVTVSLSETVTLQIANDGGAPPVVFSFIAFPGEAARRTVYASAAETEPRLAGLTCRLCDRQACPHRSHPPVTRPAAIQDYSIGLSDHELA